MTKCRFIFSFMALIAFPAMADEQVETEETAKAAPTTEDTKLICKREVETGSLVGKKKRCATKQQWDEMAASAQRGSKALTKTNAGRMTGN